MDKYNKLPITKTEAIIAIEEFEKEFNNLNKLN
jgi:hypothetical protein